MVAGKAKFKFWFFPWENSMMRKLYRAINTLTYIVAHVTLVIMTITLMALPLLIAYTSDAGPLGWLTAAFTSLVLFSGIWILTVGDPFDNVL